MLNVFQREGVENVVCVVTRYFGGVLLGAGRADARLRKVREGRARCGGQGADARGLP